MADNQMKGKILLVEPSPDLTKNLKVLLSATDGFRVIGQCTSGLDAMRMMSTLAVDVLVLDLSLPDMTGMDIARWAQRICPKTAIVLLSTYDLREYRIAAKQLKNTVLVSKAELWTKMPQALSQLRQKQVARENESGSVFLAKLDRELRGIAAWVDIAARVRDQAPVWRFIHLGMVLVSLEMVVALMLGGERAAQMMTFGWAMLSAALVHDLYTLGRSAKGTVVSTFRTVHHV